MRYILRCFPSIFLLLILLFVPCIKAFATHNRAGEITVEQIGTLTVRATIITYTKTSSIPADRDSLIINWGDGAEQTVARQNNQGEGLPLANDVKYNVYIATHTFPGRGTYKISMQDPNRNGGVLNLNYPNSDNVPFYLQTNFTFFNAQFQGLNNTPVLLQPPIDVGYVDQPFIHNPNAFDQEGDSLAYELIAPLQGKDVVVPNYLFPNQIMAGADNQISLNPVTGDFVWTSPQLKGEYNIAILIKEYRGGQLISTTIRDMQINILEGNNRPPVITTIDEICVIAGDTVDFLVKATDPDVGQRVKLTALGGPLQLSSNKAIFTAPNGFKNPPIIGRFFWIPPCEVVSDQFYQVIFKAEDSFNAIGDTFGLATLKSVRIKVVAPAPKVVEAILQANNVRISWEKPYHCENAASNYFQGFSVWRRINSNSFAIDTCETGLAGKGYTRIALSVKQMENGRYFFIDNTVESGRAYCYRIIADFARTSAGSNPYNFVESLPSEETCVQLGKDLPLITQASVLQTNISTGRIQVQWSKPSAIDLDTLLNPGPYRYELKRGEGIAPSSFASVATFTSNSFHHLQDTIYIDGNLNTSQKAYSYQVAFYVKGNFQQALGSTSAASSVFLNVASTDRKNILTWNFNVPWNNQRYVIYKQNANLTFDSIGLTTTQKYEDRDLENGKTYCYQVKSIGSYGIANIIDPILNFSEEACGIPLDTLAPCAPKLAISSQCETATDDTPSSDIFNKLIWSNPNKQCATAGVKQYHIYYAENNAATYQIIETLNTAEDTTYTHQATNTSIAGCYFVTAVDTVGNESQKSNIVCVDNCPIYKLPNVFTPNGDGANDLFKPFPYRFIEKINLKVFNRWGVLVFETSDPAINWNGNNQQGNALADGVYFYTCEVFENTMQTADKQTTLSGYIHLMKGK